MNDLFVPEYAILGHPNEGKSAVVSTLTEDDRVNVSPTPGETLQCRTYPVKIDGSEVIRFTDTPGFQQPGLTLKWLESYRGEPKEMVQAFIAAHRNNSDFGSECELFAPVARGAGILFVVDGARPIRKNDRMEMEILRLTGRPRMAIINCKDAADQFLESWKDAFRMSFNAVRVFNAHHADYPERIGFLESLKYIDQDWQVPLENVISVFKKDRENRHFRVADIICDLLEMVLNHRTETICQTESEGRAAVSGLKDRYRDDIAGIEAKAFERIRQLFKHRVYQVVLPTESIVADALFSSRTWQVLGLSRNQLAGLAAVSGGIAGAGLDLAAHGLSFGIFTAIGSAVGAGSVYLFGEQVANVRIIGRKIGGYHVRIGTNDNMNLPFILIDRSLLYFSYMAHWAHGRRDYPDHPTALYHPAALYAKDRERGFTSDWSMGEKKVCRSFSLAVRKKDTLQKEKTRRVLIDLLLKTMEAEGKTDGI